jgi:threonine/homoserine/homoserine lactone efflux protein
MDTSLFFKGIAVGLVVAPPIGPVAVVCVQRTLSQGRIQGMISGLGAAAADGFFAFVAAFGLAVVSNFVVKEQMWLRLGGGILLCCLGARVISYKLVPRTASRARNSHVTNFASTFLLTLANPGTFLMITAIFAGFGLVKPDMEHTSASLLVIGVFAGSELSWVILCGVAERVLRLLGYGKLTWLSRAAGVILVVSGLVICLSLILCRHS